MTEDFFITGCEKIPKRGLVVSSRDRRHGLSFMHNGATQPRPEAGAQRTLFAVACMPWFGKGLDLKAVPAEPLAASIPRPRSYLFDLPVFFVSERPLDMLHVIDDTANLLSKVKEYVSTRVLSESAADYSPMKLRSSFRIMGG